ncbi:MAG: hypothetical protein R3D83_02130 [Caenibius sp.]
MRFIWYAVLLTVAFAVIPSAEAKSVRKEFTEAWVARQDRYAGDVERATNELKDALNPKTPEPDLDEDAAKVRISAILEKTRQMGYSAGRADVLFRLLALMKEKPSSARAEMWFQEEADHVKQESAKADDRLNAAKAIKIGEGGVTPQEAFTEAGQAMFWLGTVQGTVDELALVNTNLASFYEAKSVEDQRRRQAWANALSSIGNSLQNSAQQNQGFMMNCTTTGPFTNCMGH